jgi:hypothetical protein
MCPKGRKTKTVAVVTDGGLQHTEFLAVPEDASELEIQKDVEQFVLQMINAHWFVQEQDEEE